MAWNIKDLVYSRAKDISAQTSYDGLIMFLSPDGLKLYVVAPTGGRIYEYTLSEAWNITTAAYVHYKGGFTYPYGMWVSPDGTKLYVADESNTHIKHYTLSTPWNVTSASLVYEWNFHAYEHPRHATSLFFNEDGTKLFIGDSTADEVYEYALSTPWDLTSESYVKSFSVAAQTDYLYGLFFKTDGTKMYVTDGHQDTVSQYNLSTPWDVATAVWSHTQGTGGGAGLSFKPDGTRMYTSDAGDALVREFDINASDYYVKTDGNDALDGESWDTAWLTIDHAQTTMGAGNRANIAAGTYDEAPGFSFAPPALSIWQGAGAALTKLIFANGNGTHTVANSGVEIHDCQISDDPGGVGSGQGWNADGNNFIMEHCSNRAVLLSFMGVDNMRFAHLTGGVGFFMCMSNLTNCTFEDMGSDAATDLFSIGGNWNTYFHLAFPNKLCTIADQDGSMTCCVFKQLDLTGGENFTVDDLEVGSGGLIVRGSTPQTITNCKPLTKITVNAGATAILSWYQQKFYESSDSQPTVIGAGGQTVLTIAGVASNITFTERSFLATTDDDISVLIASWETAGDQNKSWTVEATGSRAITFRLGDMFINTKYNLLVGEEKVSHAKSDASGVITFPEYSAAFSEKTFTTEIAPTFFRGDASHGGAINTAPAHESVIDTSPTHE